MSKTFVIDTFYSEIQKNCGVDLSDYYIDKSSYNPIVFIHKKFLPKDKAKDTNFERRKKDQKLRDKCQQFDYDRIHSETYETKIINAEYEDPVVEQTIRFAKDIIPITIPPSTDLTNPTYYTIKSCKKIKRKHEHQENNIHDKDITFNKEKSKHTIGTVKQEKYKRNKDSFSATSVTHFSPNNTIDDINENQSLSYSLSEQSKKEDYVQGRHQFQKIVASESFEAIATEYMNTPTDSKIKIHLMNEKDKQLLCENIRSPVLKAIKESFLELNNQNAINVELQNVNKAIRFQAIKLDNILEKLSSIENKLEVIRRPSPKVEINKASKLEELGQDIQDVKEDISSEEELACVHFSTKSRGKSTPVTSMYSDKDAERDVEIDNLARGENVPEHFTKPSTSQLGVNPGRSNRIPARFCWTDTVIKN